MDVNPECAPLNDCHVVCLSSLEYTRPPSSKHRGVSWDKAKSKWRARIFRNRVPHHLGHFAEEEEAAAAYRAADAALARGEELVPALHPLDGGREISASEITSLLSRTRTLDAQWDPKDSRCMIHKYGSKVCMKEVCMKEGEEGEEPGITRCMNHKSRGMIGTNRAGHVVREGDRIEVQWSSENGATTRGNAGSTS